MAETNSQWGLTSTGFYVPSYQEVLSAIQDDFILRWGNNIPLTSNSNFGIMSASFARREKAMWEQEQLVYYSAFISTATGAALDYIGGNLGLKRKVDEPSFAQITVTTQDEYLLQAGEEFETDDGLQFVLLKDLVTEKQSDGSWSGTGWVQCEDTGQDTNVEAGKITIESNPDDNVISVTNAEKADGGQDYEDDSTYRERLRMENEARPGSTAAGIRSALMNLTGVREVNIVQNPDADADQYGNPPYSVHIYILGGDKTIIAQTLADYVAAGITMVGSQDVKTQDETGNMVDMKWDFATDMPIYAKVLVDTDDSWNADEGVDDVKQSVADYINSLQMGDTVYLTRMYSPIYDIDGVKNATIEIGRNKTDMHDSNVQASAFEAPSCDPDNVEVVVNGL